MSRRSGKHVQTLEIRAVFELTVSDKLEDDEMDTILGQMDNDLSSMAVFAKTQRLAGPGLVSIEPISIDF